MNLIAKNAIVIFLMMVFLGIFTFHWFFIANSMPISECFSADCVYSSPQVVPPENRVFLSVLAVLFLLFFATFAFLTVFADLMATWGRFSVFRRRSDAYNYRFYSWLKILEKRDPQTALITARI